MKKWVVSVLILIGMSIFCDTCSENIPSYECNDEVARYIICNICNKDANLAEYFHTYEYGYAFGVMPYYSINVRTRVQPIKNVPGLANGTPYVEFTISSLLHDMILHLITTPHASFSLEYKDEASPYVLCFTIAPSLLKMLIESIFEHEIAHIIYEHADNKACSEFMADAYIKDEILPGALLFFIIHIYEYMYIASYKYSHYISDKYRANPVEYVQNNYDTFYYQVNGQKIGSELVHPSHMQRLNTLKKRLKETQQLQTCVDCKVKDSRTGKYEELFIIL